MRYRNKITDAKLVLGIGLMNQTHLTSADVVAVVIVFGAIAATADIV